jgi:hypothetical protein
MFRLILLELQNKFFARTIERETKLTKAYCILTVQLLKPTVHNFFFKKPCGEKKSDVP